jgi:Raf kinase inhibitor-like YbhB/YbcL family protein
MRNAENRLALASSAFADGGTIPRRHTADGEDLSPPLNWTSAPVGTESFALACEDPDAPSGTFVHWLAWDVEPSARQLKEGVSATAENLGMKQGENGFGRIGYGGPRPPPGKPHRYVFRLCALDTRLDLRNGATHAAFRQALTGHVLAEGVLVGTYGR